MLFFCLTKHHNLHYLFHIALEYLDFAAKLLEGYVTGKEDLRFGHVSSTTNDNHLIKINLNRPGHIDFRLKKQQN